MKEKIQALAKKYHQNTVGIRQHIHANPELSYEEVETGKYIANQLEALGIEFEHGVADNGVVGLIKGKNPDKKVIALRADIDALPITEVNDVPYKSKKEGIMHACGHDVHTASLLGAARILQELKEEFEGTIKLIFQPAEERLPGGASIMIKEGVLENPKPVSILGQHVHPPLEAGKIGLRGGIYMASADELYVTVKGQGGHGAMPQNCIDPITIAAQVITALQQVISRQLDQTIPALLTFGSIIGKGSTNIIPNEVKLKGTFRCMDEKWRVIAHEKMYKMGVGIVEAMGGTCDFNIIKGYPCLFNDESLTAKVKGFAIEYLGKENVVDLPIRMTAEDFSYYSQEMPATFYRLGTGNVLKGIISPVHTDTFNIDEMALEVGAGLMAWLAVKELETSN
ncbi:MAG: amidohydrolase [Cognaticolwellia sp.]|jgi:amidohydrolase